jgi:hypothetical protein
LRSSIASRDSDARIAAIKSIHEAATGKDAGLSQKQASDIIEKANKFPSHLLAVANRLALEDVMAVYDKASMTERKGLRPVIEDKIQKWQTQVGRGSKTPQQIQGMYDRIRRFRQTAF